MQNIEIILVAAAICGLLGMTLGKRLDAVVLGAVIGGAAGALLAWAWPAVM